MAVETEFFKDGLYWIWVNVGLKTDEHYENLNYQIPKSKDKKGRMTTPKGTKILIKVEDLKENSNRRVTKVCDLCGSKVKNQTYQNIIRRRMDNGIGIDLCSKCGNDQGGVNRRENLSIEKSLEYRCPDIANKWNFQLNKNLTPDKISAISPLIYWWKCPDCKSSFDMSADQMVRGGGSCPYCSGHRVNHTNCLWTTHPQVAALLKYPEKGYEITIGTKFKQDFQCPSCKQTIKDKIVYNIARRGISCPICSDGISYPEKFTANMLFQLEVEFEYQKTFNWSKKIKHVNEKLAGNKTYDFYISSLNCIIEVHGGQHYKRSFFEFAGGKTLEEERENDRLKEFLAKNNGITHYIVIDCARSEIDYIKNNILESNLINMFNLDNIDWLKSHEYAFNSLVKKACDLWNDGYKNIEDISEIIKLDKTTVWKYLKRGSEVGWTNYKPIRKRQIQAAE